MIFHALVVWGLLDILRSLIRLAFESWGLLCVVAPLAVVAVVVMWAWGKIGGGK